MTRQVSDNFLKPNCFKIFMYSRIQDCQLINENEKISAQGNQSNVPHNTCVSLAYPYYLIKT